jgi:hypothetical protein
MKFYIPFSTHVPTFPLSQFHNVDSDKAQFGIKCQSANGVFSFLRETFLEIWKKLLKRILPTFKIPLIFISRKKDLKRASCAYILFYKLLSLLSSLSSLVRGFLSSLVLLLLSQW